MRQRNGWRGNGIKCINKCRRCIYISLGHTHLWFSHLTASLLLLRKDFAASVLFIWKTKQEMNTFCIHEQAAGPFTVNDPQCCCVFSYKTQESVVQVANCWLHQWPKAKRCSMSKNIWSGRVDDVATQPPTTTLSRLPRRSGLLVILILRLMLSTTTETWSLIISLLSAFC